MAYTKSQFASAPLDEEGFALTDRWYCKETSTYYPAGTTTREIEKDVDSMSNNEMAFRKIELSYYKALTSAYNTYSNYRGFHKWMESRYDQADADARKNMDEQDAIMYARVRGQLELIARLFAWDDMDETTIQLDLKEMYETNKDGLA